MLQLLLVFRVVIVLFCIISGTHTNGEQIRAYLSTETHEWFNATRMCTLLENEKTIAYSPSQTQFGWTKFSAEYLPWVKYIGCFKFGDRVSFDGHEKQVTEGEQLKECMIHCHNSQRFGLQNTICVCLHNSSLTDESIAIPCDTNVTTCAGDPFAFCGVEVGRRFLSVYQKTSEDIDNNIEYIYGSIGNCLAYDTIHGKFKAVNCTTLMYPMCFNSPGYIFNIGKETLSNWQDAFVNCQHNNLSSYEIVRSQKHKINFYGEFWLSNTRRWKERLDGTRYPQFCVAARINTNGVVGRDIRNCRDKLPGLCIENRKSSSEATFTLPHDTKHLSRRRHTSSTHRRSSLPDQTTSPISNLPTLTFVHRFESTTSLALNKNIFSTYQKTVFPGFQETSSQVLSESSSAAVPETTEIDAKVIIAIIATVILVVLVITVTVVICKRKGSTQLTPPNEPMTIVKKEVVYAQVNKPTFKREEITLNQISQLAASDDTYDHMDHRRISQAHNPPESNYDTMRSIGNAGEEENSYDHVIGTNMEPKQVIVDIATNYSHVEVECNAVKDTSN